MRKRTPRKKSLKPCNKKTQERNPNTNRCVLKCKKQYERHPNNFSKCIKSCTAPQVRNPRSGRCKKPTKSKSKDVVKRRNPVRQVRKPKSPRIPQNCSVCFNPTLYKTFCTSGKRHHLCLDCYYDLLQNGIHFCPVCREYIDKRPNV